MSSMLIPLRHSERLFVALSVVVQELERKTDYPTDSLHLVLGEYELQRTKFLRSKNWFPSQIKLVTDEVTEELLDWLDGRAEKSVDEKKHLEEWEQELMNEND